MTEVIMNDGIIIKKAAFYMKKPVQVEAMQFNGYNDAIDIHKWWAKTFYIPRGYDHHLRGENEYDRSNGHILEGCADFLVLLQLSYEVRVDRSDWLVKQDHSVSLYTNEEFIEWFVKKDD